MKAKQLFLLTLSISAIALLLSCGFEFLKPPQDPLYKVYSLDSMSNRFPTSKNKKATILIAIKTNPDTLKKLIIVPEERYYKEMINHLKYFEEIRTIEELQSDINKKVLKEEIQNLTSLIALNKAYRFYKPFVILKIKKGKTIIDDKKTAFYEMSLYNPKNADLIFQSRVSYNYFIEGEGAKNIMNPLFNSLLDYLNYQNKNN